MTPIASRSQLQVLARYVTVGAASAIVEIAIFYTLVTWFAAPLMVANVVAVCSVTIAGFIAQKTFTFRSRGSITRQAPLYAVQVAINFILNNALVFVFGHLLQIRPLFAKVLQLGLCFVFNFCFSRFVVFRPTTLAAIDSSRPGGLRLGTKLFVDRVVGSLAIELLLLFARRRRDDKPSSIAPDHVVFLKLLGLGSIVQSTPLVEALRRLHPGSTFTFVTRKGNDALTQRIDLVDRTLTIDDSSLLAVAGALWRTLRELRRLPNACFINLEAYSRVGVLMTLLSGARWTAGFFRNPADLRLERVFDFLVYFNPGAPISQVYLQLGRAMGCPELAPSLARLTTKAGDEAEIDALLSAVDAQGGPVILVNPNASELRLERRWPIERFGQLISDLVSALPGSRVLLIGAPNERPYAESVLATVASDRRSSVRNAAGELSLGGLIALIKRSQLLVTNDSGPMHFAFAMGTPTVGLFGPVEPGHYASSGDASRHAILYHRVYCSPCVHHFDVAPCRGDNVCMKRIGENEVLTACLTLLREEQVQPEASSAIVYMDKGRALGVLARSR